MPQFIDPNTGQPIDNFDISQMSPEQQQAYQQQLYEQ